MHNSISIIISISLSLFLIGLVLHAIKDILTTPWKQYFSNERKETRETKNSPSNVLPSL